MLTRLLGEPDPWVTTAGDTSRILVDGSPIAARVYKRSSDGKEVIEQFAIYQANANSKDAALATDQGKKVLQGRDVSEFLNVTYATQDDTEGAQAATTSFDDGD